MNIQKRIFDRLNTYGDYTITVHKGYISVRFGYYENVPLNKLKNDLHPFEVKMDSYEDDERGYLTTYEVHDY